MAWTLMRLRPERRLMGSVSHRASFELASGVVRRVRMVAWPPIPPRARVPLRQHEARESEERPHRDVSLLAKNAHHTRQGLRPGIQHHASAHQMVEDHPHREQESESRQGRKILRRRAWLRADP